MAEVQKNVELPQETKPEVVAVPAPAVEVPAESKPVEETPAVAAETAPIAEDKPVEEAKPTETAEDATKTDETTEEIVPVEEGHLSHKAQGLSFPKNLIPSKEFFFFGSDAVEPKTLSHYLKTEKSTETAHSNIAWASESGKGLLFVGDKKAPSSVISLLIIRTPQADATEPEVDGSHKFHLTSKGNKHTFKAANTAERDNWVSQLKLKIAEAKELSATVTESETYKSTVESFKPVVPKKEEKAAETPKEEVPAVAPVDATETAPVVDETPKEEEVKEEVKSEEPKRRSASRKRTSFFGFGKKEESKKEAETKPADETAVETPAADEVPKIEEPTKVEEPVKPVEETPIVADAPKTVDETPVVAGEATPAADDKVVESPKEKPANNKRNSFFGSVFSKKEKKTPELKPTEPTTEAPKDLEAAETSAPVIPPVEATTPLAVDVASPATVPVETTEVTAATSPAPEAKKDLKEKRKSSLPFAFGKRDKSPAPGETKESAFSKLRNTIRGKSPRPTEKASDEATKEEPAIGDKVEEPKTEALKKEEETAKVAEPEAEKSESATPPAPVVTAAA
ncbi:hypothetical protein FZEAL_8613 [Fusarium zealandicum]|uniref:PH domain-containing protein n=1 Tax=Fusarium zealandicum TaxID=1053134 RepID=A0A8H4XHN6_9HYPO|nr:hypothetical protein FZEAL_8613 [Fusarium zealandicum]